MLRKSGRSLCVGTFTKFANAEAPAHDTDVVFGSVWRVRYYTWGVWVTCVGWLMEEVVFRFLFFFCIGALEMNGHLMRTRLIDIAIVTGLFFFVFCSSRFCFVLFCFRCRRKCDLMKQTKWIMLAQSSLEMGAWIDAINAQIHALFMRDYNVPKDDYRSLG